MELHFSQHFGLDPSVLRDYGAFDISIVSDLPLFVDPFLLFNSEKDEYQADRQSRLQALLGAAAPSVNQTIAREGWIHHPMDDIAAIVAIDPLNYTSDRS